MERGEFGNYCVVSFSRLCLDFTRMMKLTITVFFQYLLLPSVIIVAGWSEFVALMFCFCFCINSDCFHQLDNVRVCDF